MNKVAFHCECGERIVVDSDLAGELVDCKECNGQAEVPGGSRRVRQQASVQKKTSRLKRETTRHKREPDPARQTSRLRTGDGGRGSGRRPAPRRDPMVGWGIGAAVCVLVLLGLVFALRGTSTSPGTASDPDASSPAGDAEVLAFLDGHDQRARYQERVAREQTSENQLLARTIETAIRENARTRFRGRISLLALDGLIDRRLAAWRKAAGGGVKPPPDRPKAPDPDPPTRKPPGPRATPTLAELTRYLEGLPEKATFTAAVGRLASAGNDPKTSAWWSAEIKRLATTIRNRARLHYGGVETAALYPLVDQVLTRWRGQVKRPPPPPDPGPGTRPPPKGPRPELVALLRQVVPFLDTQPDLKAGFKQLCQRYRWPFAATANDDTKRFSNALMGRLLEKFPDADRPLLGQAAGAALNRWAQMFAQGN